MISLLAIIILSFTVIYLKGPIQNQFDKYHIRKISKLKTNKEIKLLKEKIRDLEERAVDKFIESHK